MLWRALAILAALLIPLAAALVGPGLASPWWAAGLACASGLGLVVGSEHRSQALLGASLAGLAALIAPAVPGLLRASAELEEMEVHDLRSEAIDDRSDRWIAVQGFVRNEWTLDEYRVAEGTRPDQNAPANAVIVPLLGTDGEEVDASTGIVLVARVSPAIAERGGLQTLRGKLVDVSPEVVESLFLMPEGATAKGRARMLDTFDLPTRGEAFTQLALVIVSGLLALGLLWNCAGSIRPRPLRSDAD